MVNEEIVALEAVLRDAQLHADVAALERLISDDLLFTGPDGTLATKADDIESYRSGVLRFTRHDAEELRVRRIGSTVALVALRARLEGVLAGAPFSGVFRYTRVWAREDGRAWQIVGGHVSAMSPAA